LKITDVHALKQQYIMLKEWTFTDITGFLTELQKCSFLNKMVSRSDITEIQERKRE